MTVARGVLNVFSNTLCLQSKQEEVGNLIALLVRRSNTVAILNIQECWCIGGSYKNFQLIDRISNTDKLIDLDLEPFSGGALSTVHSYRGVGYICATAGTQVHTSHL